MAKMTNDSNIGRIWDRIREYIHSKLANKMDTDGNNAGELINLSSDNTIIFGDFINTFDRPKIITKTEHPFSSDVGSSLADISFSAALKYTTGPATIAMRAGLRDFFNSYGKGLVFQLPNRFATALAIASTYEFSVNFTDNQHNYPDGIPDRNGIPTLPYLSDNLEVIEKIINDPHDPYYLNPLLISIDSGISYSSIAWMGRRITFNGSDYVLSYTIVCRINKEQFLSVSKVGNLPEGISINSDVKGAVIVFDDKVHLFGVGTNNNEHYVTENFTEWTKLSDIPFDCRGTQPYIYDGELRLIAGWNGYNHYKYDNENDTWTSIQLSYSMYFPGVIVYHGDIYLIGKSTNDSYRSQRKNIYKSTNGGTSWTKLTNLPFEYNTFGYRTKPIILDDKIYLIGTSYYSDNSRICKYTTDGETWYDGPELPEWFCSLNTSHINGPHISVDTGKIIYYSDEQVNGEMIELDTVYNEWVGARSLVGNRYGRYISILPRMYVDTSSNGRLCGSLPVKDNKFYIYGAFSEDKATEGQYKTTGNVSGYRMIKMIPDKEYYNPNGRFDTDDWEYDCIFNDNTSNYNAIVYSNNRLYALLKNKTFAYYDYSQNQWVELLDSLPGYLNNGSSVSYSYLRAMFEIDGSIYFVVRGMTSNNQIEIYSYDSINNEYILEWQQENSEISNVTINSYARYCIHNGRLQIITVPDQSTGISRHYEYYDGDITLVSEFYSKSYAEITNGSKPTTIHMISFNNKLHIFMTNTTKKAYFHYILNDSKKWELVYGEKFYELFDEYLFKAQIPSIDLTYSTVYDNAIHLLISGTTKYGHMKYTEENGWYVYTIQDPKEYELRFNKQPQKNYFGSMDLWMTPPEETGSPYFLLECLTPNVKMENWEYAHWAMNVKFRITSSVVLNANTNYPNASQYSMFLLGPIGMEPSGRSGYPTNCLIAELGSNDLDNVTNSIISSKSSGQVLDNDIVFGDGNLSEYENQIVLGSFNERLLPRKDVHYVLFSDINDTAKELFTIGGGDSDLNRRTALAVDYRGNILSKGGQIWAQGRLKGVLIRNSPYWYDLEDGGCYIVTFTSRTISNNAFRGIHSYLISIPWPSNDTGAQTTAGGVGRWTSITLGSAGTVGHYWVSCCVPYVHTDPGTGSTYTRYHSRIGIGSTATSIDLRFSIVRVMGSVEDFS